MVSKPVTLGPSTLGKSVMLPLTWKAMLHKYDVGDKVSAADAEVLRAALARHPDADAKVRCGIANFSVRSADFGSKCFWVNRTDGSTENRVVLISNPHF